ncbi:hypothetical protein [Candidatus Williamhamiltonella defendens]|uniref:hypothetical protein n=1 Tax=Candidatus Williamhamiltonella defendens TaxID=138072 RepID=UPI00130E3AC3|nr:hypothetical protein [Candidatus Hamiltonella defensa]
MLAHRNELNTQNNAKCRRVNPSVSTSVFDAHAKSWDDYGSFAMVRTLCRDSNLKNISTLDLLVINVLLIMSGIAIRTSPYSA